MHRRDGWSQTLGDYVELTWHGTIDYARAVYADLRNNCSECDKEEQGPTGIVRARFANQLEPGGDEELRVEIRSGRNDVQKSIFEPGPDGFSNGVDDTELRRIQATIENPESAVAYDEWQDNATADGLALYKLALAGVRYRIVYQPVIIQVTTASGQFQWPNVNYLAGDILLQNTMLGLLRMTPNFTPPSTANVPAAAPDGFAYGWKMAPPTYESSSDGRSVETLEFEFGLWPTQLYGDPV